ncbi:MAG: Ig-like domain-containing protein [Bacteroidales bacterium]|nr:Ig-like domain-containing protein [Bacteroidales bacterium]MDT8431565.1 Ig-like domain-containing protein [Bacteroidales bacterium]
MAFVSFAAFSQTTVWNPAANPDGTGLWTEAANWTNGLPVPAGKVVLNVPGAADCVLDAAAEINQFVLGDNGGGDDVLRIVNGGALTTGANWSMVQRLFQSLVIVDVEEITVTGADGATTITTMGGTLQMTATVLPAEATDPSVTWSVDDETIATIDENGLLTAVADGDVTVTATANDGSGVNGSLVVTISNQDETGIGSADMLSKGLTIYPNPVGEILNIRSARDVAMISILDVAGHAVRTMEHPGRESSVNLEGIPAGVYMLKVQDHEANTVIRRILKQ